MTEKVTREDFLKMSLGFIAVLWGSMTSYPVFRFLTAAARLQEQDSRNQVTSLTMGAVADFLPGSSKNFKFGNIPALLIRDSSGEFFAYNAICTHLGCTVQHSKEKSKIFCACHGGTFDTKTGKNLAGPPPKPLAKLAVNIEQGQIVVSRV